MREDFVTRLKLQLRDAAEREARGGVVAHTLRDTRWRLSSPVIAAACGVLLLAVAALAGALALRGEDPPPASLSVVGELKLTGNPEGMVTAFGSVWIADPVAGDVVRADPASRRVLSRIHVGSRQRIMVTRVGGELWVPEEGKPALDRIDPATNSVRARVRLRTPDGRPFQALEVLTGGGVVWGIGSEGALRLDPQTGEGLRLAGAPSAETEAIGFALGEDGLWALRSDRSIHRLDPHTGAESGRLRDAPPDTGFIFAVGRDLLAAPDRDGSFARLDGTTGRVEWERQVGDRINEFSVDGDVLWLHTTVGGSDRLTALALDSGRDIGATELGTFGSTGLAAVGREVWVDTAAGRTVVVRR